MTDEERYELVQLRKENAQRTLCEAKLMLDNGYWNGAVNRMYYACFYAVTALLIQHGIKAQTHLASKLARCVLSHCCTSSRGSAMIAAHWSWSRAPR